MSPRKNLRRTASLLVPVAFWAACGGGGGGGVPDDPTGLDAGALSEVPLVGQFLADCEGSVAVIEAFVAASPLGGEAENLPSAADVLDSGDPDTIAVLGGLVPAAGAPEELEALSAEDTLAMIPASGLSGSLPILATVPVTCGTVPLLLSALSDPTNAPSLVPVFDENGDPVGLILATIGDGDPGDLGLPGGVETLPESLASTVASLLAILGPIAPQPTPTPTGGLPQPTPTPTTGSGQQFCGGPWNVPCPTGQLCVTLPGDSFGTCEGAPL